MARIKSDTGQAAVLDGGQIKRLIKIAQTTNHAGRDQTAVVLSYWLGLRAKELGRCHVNSWSMVVGVKGADVQIFLHL